MNSSTSKQIIDPAADDLGTRDGLLKYLGVLQKAFAAAELCADEVFLPFAMMRAQQTFLPTAHDNGYDAARGIAFFGQKFLTYIGKLIECAERPATGQMDARHWIDIVAQHNYISIRRMYGDDAAAAFREHMIMLGERCLGFAEQQSQSNTPAPLSRNQHKHPIHQKVRSLP